MGALARCIDRQACLQGPGLWLLENPRQSLWQGAQPKMRPVAEDEVQSLAQKKIMLFIHGMEYGCGHEVIKDFVRPFERGAGIFETGNRSDVHCLFLHWNSCVKPQGAMGISKILLRNLWRPLHLRGLIQEAVSGVEIKASVAAEAFARFIEPLVCREGGVPPLIITHSMGAYLWAETVQTLLMTGKQLLNLGQWWSLQPALTWTALDSEGEFEAVGALYTAGSFRKTIWYSSFDIVLATLYVIGKGRFAMGQLGARLLPVEQVNLALSAREAHGATCLGYRAENFFSRVRTLIRGKIRDFSVGTLGTGTAL